MGDDLRELSLNFRELTFIVIEPIDFFLFIFKKLLPETIRIIIQLLLKEVEKKKH